MAQLLALAHAYQQALDGYRASTRNAASEAGRELYMFRASMGPYPSDDAATRALEPIILQTTLAASIVTYLERIPWVAVTPQMLSRPLGTPLSELLVCGDFLGMFLECAVGELEASCSARSTVSRRLLQQVRSFES